MLIKSSLVNLLLTIVIKICSANNDCIQRKYDDKSFVCVCNSTYCDSIAPLPENLCSKQYVVYVSTSTQDRMKQTICEFENKSKADDEITISRTKKYQTIMGFGGAMTDATGINIASLPKAAQDLLLQQYFGDNGIQYTIIRVPIGGSDFSTRPYTLDDTPCDKDLTNFKLAEEDYKYKIPYLKQAKNLSRSYSIKLMGCPWSAPPYMKYNNSYVGGRLLDEYFPTYAVYFTKFLQAYKDEGLNFYIISPQNEPDFPPYPGCNFIGMILDSDSEANFVGNYLGPTMEQNGFSNVKILIGDDQRPNMFNWVQNYLKNENASKYASGVGIHWYRDSEASPNELTKIHNLPGFENKFILYTEASNMLKLSGAHSPRLGSWTYATKYLSNIIDDLNHWSEGWVDWNMALDLEGGPNWANNFVDSPIIVNASAKEFYKNPMYYALAHVSKFVVPGSVRIDITNNNDFVKATAVETPYNQTIVVLLNTLNRVACLSIKDENKDGLINLEVEPESMVTIVY